MLQKAGHHFHDKNFTSDERRHQVQQLRHKYMRNQRLSTYNKQPTYERALSWNDSAGDLALRRTSDVKLNARAGRAVTVDFSPKSSVSVESPGTPMFGLDDTVFETDEEIAAEHDPLLEEDNTTALVKHVQFAVGQKQARAGSSGAGAGKAGQSAPESASRGTDIDKNGARPVNKVRVQYSRANSAPMNAAPGRSLDNANKDPSAVTRGGTQSPTTDAPRPPTERLDSTHAGHLLRQNALVDSDVQSGLRDTYTADDIPLQDMTGTTQADGNDTVDV